MNEELDKIEVSNQNRWISYDFVFLKVKHMLDQYELRGMEVLDFDEFVVSIITQHVNSWNYKFG